MNPLRIPLLLQILQFEFSEYLSNILRMLHFVAFCSLLKQNTLVCVRQQQIVAFTLSPLQSLKGFSQMKNLVLSEKLKKLRLAKGYSQEEVARQLNISRQAYQHYECGRRTPNAEYLRMLAELYNLQIYDLLISDISLEFADQVSEEPIYPQSVAELEQRLIKAFRKLTEKEKQKLVKQAEAMVWKKG